MNRRLLTLGTLTLALGVALVLAGCGGTKTVTRTVTESAAPSTSPSTQIGAPSEQVLFGHIKSLTRQGSHYELRFDPAWFTSGLTANTAAAEDKKVDPGQPVPNDNYRVEEGHRLLTYTVPARARVTVITNHGDPAKLGATPITVAELADIVAGKSKLKLFEPLDSGVWIRVRIDSVRSLDQQYQP